MIDHVEVFDEPPIDEKTISVFDRNGTQVFRIINEAVCFRDGSTDLSKMLNEFFSYHYEEQIRIFRNRYPVEFLLSTKDVIKNYFKQIRKTNLEDYKLLIKHISSIEVERKKFAVKRLANGECSFSDLPYLLCKDTEIVTEIDNELVGGVIVESKIDKSVFGNSFGLVYRYISNISGSLQFSQSRVVLYDYVGLKHVSSLAVRPVTEADKQKLEARGNKFLRYAENGVHAHCDGVLQIPNWFGFTPLRAKGRVMLDVKTFQTIVPEQYERLAGYNRDQNIDMKKILSEKIWMTSPFLYGFSFAAKAWGRFRVQDISDIVWREDSFEKLVLPSDEKKIIHSLVKHHGVGFQDLVDNKSGGCVFLLAGYPGQGKTLAAESTAEVLHRPLYSISVGELGITPEAVEEKLRMILDVANLWNAVILLDEAEIFIEKRDSQNILRNAIVCVFLKLLEYHQGVIFLTTNRAESIDPAVLSRVSMTINFSKADQTKRTKIWENLATAATIRDKIDIGQLSKYDLNGRQIKNIIRIAQTLAKADDSEVSMKHFTLTLDTINKAYS